MPDPDEVDTRLVDLTDVSLADLRTIEDRTLHTSARQLIERLETDHSGD